MISAQKLSKKSATGLKPHGITHFPAISTAYAQDVHSLIPGIHWIPAGTQCTLSPTKGETPKAATNGASMSKPSAVNRGVDVIYSSPPYQGVQDRPSRPIRTLGISLAAPYTIDINGVEVMAFQDLNLAEITYQLLRSAVKQDHGQTKTFRPAPADGTLNIDPDEYPATNALLLQYIDTFKGLRTDDAPCPTSIETLEEIVGVLTS